MNRLMKLFSLAVTVGIVYLLYLFISLYQRQNSVSFSISFTEPVHPSLSLQQPPSMGLKLEQSHSAVTSKHVNHQSASNNTSNLHVSKRSGTLHHKYEGKVLISGAQKTEIVSAFFDLRQGKHMIVVLGCHNHHSQHHYFCHLRYSDGREKCFAKETSQELLSSADENGSKPCWSYRFVCTLESSDDLPTAVALTASSDCGSPRSEWVYIKDSRYEDYKTGSLQVKEVIHGVCFQSPLYRADGWSREVLTESIERYRALGAEWFTLYYRSNPSREVMQLLSEYESQGILEVINMTISDATYYDVRYYGELLAIRDCVYRNMYRTKYLAMTDIDEVIVPQRESHLKNMLLSLDSKSAGAFQFKHVAMMARPGEPTTDGSYPCPDSSATISKPLFITNTYKTKPFPIPEAVSVGRWKVVVKPQYVDKIGIHSVYTTMPGFTQIQVDPSVGVLYHYRHKPFFNSEKCRECSEDKRFTELTPDLLEKYITKACLGKT